MLIERVSADAKVRKIRIIVAINRRDAVAKDVDEIDADETAVCKIRNLLAKLCVPRDVELVVAAEI